jgi:hypothetical protein
MHHVYGQRFYDGLPLNIQLGYLCPVVCKLPKNRSLRRIN